MLTTDVFPNDLKVDLLPEAALHGPRHGQDVPRGLGPLERGGGDGRCRRRQDAGAPPPLHASPPPRRLLDGWHA